MEVEWESLNDFYQGFDDAFENKNSVPEMIEINKEIIAEFENIEMEPPINMVDKLIILIDLYTYN